MLEYTLGLIIQLMIFVILPGMVYLVYDRFKPAENVEKTKYEKYKRMFEEMKKGG